MSEMTSRTDNIVENMKTGLIVQLLNKILAFVVRTVFIKVLSTEYLGVNGLFTNILTILSFAELGIGNAIIFSMYKPVANNDQEKIKSLVKLYKKSYETIGMLVLAIGMCIMPFLNVIIKDTPNIKENISFIYFLFLLDTGLSYFFTYKKSIISAYQKESIINNYTTIIYLIRAIAQIIFLLITKNFIIYLIIQISSTLILNIVLSLKADKMFPYLKEKDVQKLEDKEKKSIYSNVKALIIYKFGAVILNGTDNIIISSMINVSMVGLCSNYTLIIESVKSILKSILNGVKASVGNLNASDDVIKKEKIFYQLFFICFWFYTFCCVAIMVLINPFIKLWIGEQYILGQSIIICLVLTMYIDGLRLTGITYRETLGLFEKGKLSPFMAATFNIIFSIILGKIFGVAGIFLATSIANIMTLVWVDPYLIHKYEFKSSVKKYFKTFLKYIITYFYHIFSISFS